MVALLLMAVLVGVFLQRAVYYRELAEKSAMEQVALDLRSSVNLRVAELVLESRFAELGAIQAVNPMDLLAGRPQNYLGVLDQPRPASPARGNWYFDKKSKEVVYCVDLGLYFTPDESGRPCVSWHVVLVPGKDPASAPQWARFELVKPYRWF